MPKDRDFYGNTFPFGLPPNLFVVSNPKDHSALKSLLSSYFSRKTVLKLEAVVQERLDQLISQLLRNHKTSPADMNRAYRSVTLDVITLYTLRTSVDATSFPSFNHPAIIGVEETFRTTWIARHLTSFTRIVLSLPRWLALYLSPAAKPNFEMQEEIEKLVDLAIADSRQRDEHDDSEDLNVFHTILRNSRIDGKLRHSNWVTKNQMIAEAVGLRIAGSDTVGNTCTTATRYLVRDDQTRRKLVEELVTAWPDKGNPMSLERLEKLPYLTAVIKESLRLSSGVITPMPRVVPETGAIIAGHTVPPGTVVSIGNTFVHMNPDIFPEPERFYPERWLEDKDHSLDRYLVALGKGPRSCIGIK
ncbi:hypothetical protein VNI00_005419 [Paramarasmius palmivorus]|uniref:Cytochrome P450 n=1 Tax=Paramarasmius palmivorus TaxID=297713 RepID=A0AAW0DGL8_9AGAR